MECSSQRRAIEGWVTGVSVTASDCSERTQSLARVCERTDRHAIESVSATGAAPVVVERASRNPLLGVSA